VVLQDGRPVVQAQPSLWGWRSLLLAAACSQGSSVKQNGTSPSVTASLSPSELELEAHPYQVGDCVTWASVTPTTLPTLPTTLVPCSQPHRIEITAPASYPAAPGASYPSTDQWTNFAQTGPCLAAATALLGRPHDPYGKFPLTTIDPRRSQWVSGDRSVWCALGSGDFPADVTVTLEFPLWSVDARGADQTRLLPVGTCLNFAETATVKELGVPCAQPHTSEIAGYVNLAGIVSSFPPTDDAWARAIGTRCSSVADSYLGIHRLPSSPVKDGALHIALESWAAARRTVECIVVRYENGAPVPFEGPMRDHLT
jgi:hypothetical protein